MKNFKLKSILLLLAFVLSIGQMWADPWVKNDVSTGSQGTKTVGNKLNGGSDWWYNYQTNGGWSTGTDIQVLIGTSTSSYSTVNAEWYEDSGSNKKVHANIGSFTFDKSGIWYAVGKYKSGSTTAYTSGTSFTSNTSLSTSMSTSNSPYWTVNPPSVKSFSVTEVNHKAGSGTEADPYIMPYNGTLSLTISGSQNVSDANSSAQYYNTSSSNAWSTTATKSISGITSTTATSVTVKMRYNNSTASLSGAESVKEIWYKSETCYNITATTSGHGTVTPTSATAAGQYSGGDITASPSTGYQFSAWAISSGSGYFGATGTSTTSTTANTKFRPTAASTLSATFAAKTYSITLDKNHASAASDGSATATYDGGLSSITAPTYTGYHVVGYYKEAGLTNKIANGDGSLCASTDYTDESGNWTNDDAVTLYAKWAVDATTYSLTFLAGSSPYNHGSVSGKVGGTTVSSGASHSENSNVALTANADTHYRLKGWYYDAACTESPIDGAGTDNPYEFTLTGNTTVYAAFESSQTVITLNKNGGSTGAASVTATHGNALGAFTAHARDGYTLDGYYTTSSGGTKIINADGTLVASSDYTDDSKWNSDDRTLTLYAQWTEVKQTITTSVQYDAGTSSYTAVAANQVGVVTTSTLTASNPNSSHYTFAGWTLTNLEVTSGDASTDRVITVRVDDPSGDAPAAVANYNEVLTQDTWVLEGGSAFGGTAWSTKHAMSKKSGASTSDVVYFTVNITATNTGSSNGNYQFKIVKNGATDTYYGLAADGASYYLLTGESGTEKTLNSSGKNIELRADVKGTYEFKLDYSTPSAPKLTVQFPSLFLKGDFNSWSNDKNPFDDNGIVRVSLTAATHEFKVRRNGADYGCNATMTTSTKDYYFSTGESANCKITVTTAGVYTFGWDNEHQLLTVYYPSDTTKVKFTAGEYIYFDTRTLGSVTGWNKAKFSTRFWFKNYASALDFGSVDCAIADTVEQGIFYAKVPANNYIGQVQINRMATDFKSILNTANKVFAVDRSATTYNCLGEQSGCSEYEDLPLVWKSTTYCPPMKSVVLADNGTTIAAGSGTKAEPYLIAASTTIKVTAASSTAYNDDAHMTHKYHFYDDATSKSEDQTGTTCEISASSSLNTVHKIVVKSFNTYNSQSSRVKKSDTLYYKTVAVYNVRYNANGADVGTAPSVATQYPSGYTHTVLGNSGGLAKEGYTFYAWNEAPDGSGDRHPVDGTVTFASSDITLYAEWADDHIYYFSGATDDDWSTASNWTKRAVPNDIANTIYILKPVEIPASTTIKAAAVNLVTGGTYTRPYSQGTVADCAGHLSIAAGGELVIDGALKKVEDASDMSTKVPTTETDLHIGSDGTNGNGALVMGSHDGTNQATVDFYTKSHGDLAADQRAYAKNQFIGTPFNDCSDITYKYYNSWVYGVDYSGSKPTWKRINSGEGMDPFKGYCVISADAADHVYQMEGTLVASSDQTITLSYKDETPANNENLLANSWTAPIRIASFAESDFTNADATIYIFNTGSPNDIPSAGSAAIDATRAGQWITIPISSGSWGGKTPTVSVIPSMQSFSIYSNNEDPSKTPKIKLDYDHLVLTPAKNGTAAIVPNRAPKADGTIDEEDMGDPEVLRLFVRGTSGFGDNVIMLAREDFTDGFDNGWDGRKVFGAEVAPQMYALTTNGNMAYNCVPDMEGTVLAFTKGTEDATYTFSFEYEGDDTWYLNDLKEQTSTLISELDTYTFTSMAGDNAARFVISHTPIAHTPTAIENGGAIDGANVRKLMIDGTLYIIRGGQMFTADGQMVR